MQYVVYRITNTRNKKVYIGSTSQFLIRKAEHLGQLRARKHCNYFLQREFNDFKEESFVFDIIRDDFKTRESMLLYEYELILKNKGKCYNIDTDCPAVSGGNKKSYSVRREGKLLYGKKEKVLDKKKIKRKGKPHKPKMVYPELDKLIAKKKEREQKQIQTRTVPF